MHHYHWTSLTSNLLTKSSSGKDSYADNSNQLHLSREVDQVLVIINDTCRKVLTNILQMKCKATHVYMHKCMCCNFRTSQNSHSSESSHNSYIHIYLYTVMHAECLRTYICQHMQNTCNIQLGSVYQAWQSSID